MGPRISSWPRKLSGHVSAELKGPRKLSRIRPEIFDSEPDLGLKLARTKPRYLARYPQAGTQRFRTELARFPSVSTTIRNFYTVRWLSRDVWIDMLALSLLLRIGRTREARERDT